MNFAQFWGFAFVLSLPRSFFSPSFGYGLAVFSSLQPAWRAVLSVALPGGYTSVPLVSLSPPLPFSTSGPHSGEWLVESYYRSHVWFIQQLKTLTNSFFINFQPFTISTYKSKLYKVRNSEILILRIEGVKIEANRAHDPALYRPTAVLSSELL